MKYFYWLFLALAVLLILRLNQLLYKDLPQGTDELPDIVRQLNFLESELKDHELGQQMQMLYPEGYVFIYSLYGLTWSELAKNPNISPSEKLRANEEALYAFRNIDSSQGRQPFDQSMAPPFGIYYQGWRNYLLAKLLAIGLPFEGREALVLQFQDQCDEIASALRKSDSPFLASYPGQSWPADSFLGMASLSIHDQLFQPKYQVHICDWTLQVRDKFDPKTGMIPHKTATESGGTTQSARGGSMALMLRLLAEISPSFAEEQYPLFRQNFKSRALGLPMVREYPKGVLGMGDVDSGPVILGTGFAATIVSIGTYRMFGDDALAQQQYQVVHAFGLSRQNDSEKSYLWGMLPMADAFIAWSRTAPILFSESEGHTSSLWRLRFQLWSIFLILLLCLPLFKTKLIRFYQMLRGKTATEKQ